MTEGMFGEAMTAVPVIERRAEISPCGKYRYWLGRRWDASCYRLTIIMLNPSTADAEIDDPTIRRCMTFARREGYGGILVLNLFAYRATSPDDMKAAADPVGPNNNYNLLRVLRDSHVSDVPVLCAWGAHGSFEGRANWLLTYAIRERAKLVCLGKTKEGHPRHPLYVKGNQEFLEYYG